MKNEFPADSMWAAPCTAMGGCPDGQPDTWTGTQVLEYYQMDLLDLGKVGMGPQVRLSDTVLLHAALWP